MTIRLSSDSIRVRLEAAEAELLLDTGKFHTETAGGYVDFESQVVSSLKDPVQVVLGERKLSVRISKETLVGLIEEERTKKSGLRLSLPSTNGEPILFVLEIDLFSTTSN